MDSPKVTPGNVDHESSIQSTHIRSSARRATVVLNTDLGTSLASRADRSFAKAPLIGTFFQMLRPKSNRKVGEFKFVTLKTGMFSWRVIYELFSLKFMQYKILYGEDDEDLRENFNNQQNCVGLVAALLFTVFLSFIQNEAGGNFNFSIFQTFEVTCWAIASICSLAATCLSVLLIIALSETNGPEDSNHFIRLLGEFTYGLGPISSVFFLLIGAIFALLALIPYSLLNFGLTCSLTMFTATVIVISLFGLFVVQTVATLKVAKDTDALINASYRVVDLNLAQIRAAFKGFVAANTNSAAYVEHVSLSSLPVDCDEDQFLLFLQSSSHLICPQEEQEEERQRQEQEPSKLVGSAISGSSAAATNMQTNTSSVTPDTNTKTTAGLINQPLPCLIKLSLISERRARAFFAAYLEANLFESVAVDTFTPAH